MGVVYLATDRNLGRRVALKLLPEQLAADADFRARFIRESKMAAAIDDPNILPVYDAGEVDGVLFIAMRYVEGSDLEARLRAGALVPDDGDPPPRPGRQRARQRPRPGLVHRDVKPGQHPHRRGLGMTSVASMPTWPTSD